MKKREYTREEISKLIIKRIRNGKFLLNKWNSLEIYDRNGYCVSQFKIKIDETEIDIKV